MRKQFLTGALANIKPGIWIAFNALRTLIIGIGVTIGLALGVYAFEFGAVFGFLVAAGYVVILIIAMCLIWRPDNRLFLARSGECFARDSTRWLERQARFKDLKGWLSVAGTALGACAILLVSFVTFFGGSPIAGLCFFCSGAMAMRVAWTLIGVQRSTGGKES